MNKDSFFLRALDSFSASYDIERDAQVLSRRVDAKATFRALNSKYVLSKKHVLWEANAFEHMLFVKADCLTKDMVADWVSFLTGEAEAELVHPGLPCPPEGHMYTYLTLVFICDTAQEDALREVRRAKFTKNYRFSLRGWATARTAAVVLGDGRVEANAAGRDIGKHLKKLLSKP